MFSLLSQKDPYILRLKPWYFGKISVYVFRAWMPLIAETSHLRRWYLLWSSLNQCMAWVSISWKTVTLHTSSDVHRLLLISRKYLQLPPSFSSDSSSHFFCKSLLSAHLVASTAPDARVTLLLHRSPCYQRVHVQRGNRAKALLGQNQIETFGKDHGNQGRKRPDEVWEGFR